MEWSYIVKADLDFAVSYRLSSRSGVSRNVTFIITILVLIITLLIASTVVFFVVLNISDTKYINEMRLELADYEAQRIIIENKQKKLDEATTKLTAINNVNALIAGDRMLSKAEVKVITNCLTQGTMIINAFYENSSLVLECETTDVYAPSNSADRLEKAGITTLVGYNGFTYKEASEKINENGDRVIVQFNPNEPKIYNFTLTCMIGASEGGDSID